MNTTTIPATLTLRGNALVLDLLEPRRVISGAPFRGGLISSRYLVNCTVSRDFNPVDLQAAIRAELEAIRLPYEGTTCCLTAVDVWNYAQGEASEGQVRTTAFVTAGLGNLSSPGLTPISGGDPGTINTIALLEADISDAALVETVQIIAEVKARALLGYVTSDGHPATGTSTDTITVALLPGPRANYAGAATAVGRSLAQAVDRALLMALDGL
jgi:adenosylcobinamide amidohydrolase